jgi:hypothetical protein
MAKKHCSLITGAFVLFSVTLMSSAGGNTQRALRLKAGKGIWQPLSQ